MGKPFDSEGQLPESATRVVVQASGCPLRVQQQRVELSRKQKLSGESSLHNQTQPAGTDRGPPPGLHPSRLSSRS